MQTRPRDVGAALRGRDRQGRRGPGRGDGPAASRRPGRLRRWSRPPDPAWPVARGGLVHRPPSRPQPSQRRRALGHARHETFEDRRHHPSRAGRTPPPHIDLHRTRRLPSADTTTHEGIPVTTAARTLTDLADVLTQPALRRALDEAEYLRLPGVPTPIRWTPRDDQPHQSPPPPRRRQPHPLRPRGHLPRSPRPSRHPEAARQRVHPDGPAPRRSGLLLGPSRGSSSRPTAAARTARHARGRATRRPTPRWLAPASRRCGSRTRRSPSTPTE